MFKHLWDRLNYLAEVLGIDEPRGDHTFRLEERVAKLERKVEGLQIQPRTTPIESPDGRVHRLQSHLQQ